MASASGTQAASKSRAPRAIRLRYGNLPKPPEHIEVPYGRKREGLAGLSCGQETMLVANHPAFDAEIGRICRQLDAVRAGRRGPAPVYTALECEFVLLYQRVCGLRSYREARNRLAGDRAEEARRLLGLVSPRGTRAQKLRAGIPSEATISRHLKRFGEKRRTGAYERLFKAIVRDHLTRFPEMRDEARILALDGSKIETHYTCPKVDKNGQVANASSVTCPDGGYVGFQAGPYKSGHGFNGIALVTLTGLPLTNVVTRLNDSETRSAEALVDLEIKRDVLPHLDQDELHVLVADGGFQSQTLRHKIRELGWVEQIHHASHADSEQTKQYVRRLSRIRRQIRGYPNWYADGHREIHCNCGQGQLSKRISRKDGKTTIRTEGSCPTCGTISITSGRWRFSQNPDKFVRCHPDERDRADYSFGNPLTFHDQLATIYGRKRFSHNEGFHAQLTTRYGLYKGKRWFRRRDQARLDTAITFSIIHVLAMEHRQHLTGIGALAGAGASVSPGLAGSARADDALAGTAPPG